MKYIAAILLWLACFSAYELLVVSPLRIKVMNLNQELRAKERMVEIATSQIRILEFRIIALEEEVKERKGK